MAKLPPNPSQDATAHAAAYPIADQLAVALDNNGAILDGPDIEAIRRATVRAYRVGAADAIAWCRAVLHS